jgi:hypothetical protein
MTEHKNALSRRDRYTIKKPMSKKNQTCTHPKEKAISSQSGDQAIKENNTTTTISFINRKSARNNVKSHKKRNEKREKNMRTAVRVESGPIAPRSNRRARWISSFLCLSMIEMLWLACEAS